jgi:hypothetical protein
MSIELNVHANREVLTRELLSRECNSPDLREEMRWEIVFLRVEDGSADFDQNGKLKDDQKVAGWPISSKTAAEVRDAFARKDKQALARLYQAEAYGQVDLFLFIKESDEWDGDDPDYLEGIPEEHLLAVKQATCRYSLETHASRNDVSLGFQQFLWRMIGVLTYGLLEDPQEGEYVNCAEDATGA